MATRRHGANSEQQNEPVGLRRRTDKGLSSAVESALAISWRRAWAALGLRAPDADFAELLQSYREPHRHYHTLQHLQECIALLEPLLAQAERPGEVELALWFHDAVYNTRAKDNESRSAAWASRVLIEQGAATEVVWRVRDLILATAHTAKPQGHDARLLVDVDLGILGADRRRFSQYEHQVRAEYGWVHEDAYRAGRRKVLLGFLQRPAIYTCAIARLESQARGNIECALAALARPSDASSAPETNALAEAARCPSDAATLQRPAQTSPVEATFSELAIGATLWWVDDSHRREEGEVTVIGLQGRRAELSNGILLDLDSMCAVPDPISRGRCYLSREDKLAAHRLIDDWAEFTRDVSTLLRPKGIDVEGIRALRAQLGVPDWRKRDADNGHSSADAGRQGGAADEIRREPRVHWPVSVQASRAPLVDAVLNLISRRVASAGTTVLTCGVVPGSKADGAGERWTYTMANGYGLRLIVDPGAAPGMVKLFVAVTKGLSETAHPLLWFRLLGNAESPPQWRLEDFIAALAEVDAAAAANDAETQVNK